LIGDYVEETDHWALYLKLIKRKFRKNENQKIFLRQSFPKCSVRPLGAVGSLGGASFLYEGL
jgi:hypothetical protein